MAKQIIRKTKRKYRKSKEKVVTRCANCGKYAKKKWFQWQK